MSIPHIGHDDAQFPAADKTIDPETGEVQRDGAPNTVLVREARAVARSTPTTKRGVHVSREQGAGMMRCINSVDWLNLTFFSDDLPGVQAALERVAPGLGALERLKGQSIDCEEQYAGLHGLKIFAHPHAENQHYVRLEASGAVCRALGVDGTAKLLHEAWFWGCSNEARWHVTRIDLASDIPREKLRVRWVWLANQKRLIAGRFDYEKVKHFEGGAGETVQFGSRQSDKMVVFYENDGNEVGKQQFGAGVAFTRCEQRFYGDAAQMVVNRLLAAGSEGLGDVAAGLLKGYMDIPKRWFRSFVGEVSAAAVMLSRARSTITKTLAWMARAVAPSFALCFDALEAASPGSGMDWWDALRADGRRRRSAVGAARVRTNQLEGLPRFAIYGVGGAS